MINTLYHPPFSCTIDYDGTCASTKDLYFFSPSNPSINPATDFKDPNEINQEMMSLFLQGSFVLPSYWNATSNYDQGVQSQSSHNSLSSESLLLDLIDETKDSLCIVGEITFR